MNLDSKSELNLKLKKHKNKTTCPVYKEILILRKQTSFKAGLFYVFNKKVLSDFIHGMKEIFTWNNREKVLTIEARIICDI